MTALPQTVTPHRRLYAQLAVGAVGALLVTFMVLDRDKTLIAGDPLHNGIARSGPSVSTYGLILCVLAYSCLLGRLFNTRQTERLLPGAALPFLVFLGAGLALIWEPNAPVVAGVEQYALGLAAWAVGAWLAPTLVSNSRWLAYAAYALTGLIGLEAVVAVAQLAGVPINPMSPSTAAIMGDRVNGTLNHPNNLGKAVLLLVILALAVLPLLERTPRRVLTLGLLGSLIPLGLAQGRANLLAFGLLLLAWAALARGRKMNALRVGIPVALVVAAAPFVGPVLDRFQNDPEGGNRPQLRAAAMDQIRARPMTGLGPNNYVEVVSAYDLETAKGYPVHNAFLLTSAEMGIPGAILFWLIPLSLVPFAWRARGSPGPAGSFSTAFLASIPGMLLILNTGWAMLSQFSLPMWFLLLGMTYGLARPVAMLGAMPTRQHHRGIATATR